MNVYPKLKAVTPMDDYRLLLVFGDDEKRIYDFAANLTHPFFASLKDVNLFKAVSVEDGEIIWSTGQDFCPRSLYECSLPLARTTVI